MKRFVLAVLVIHVGVAAFCQKDNYVDGYIVTNDSKVVFTDIAYQDDNNAHLSCLVKSKNGEVKEYLPDELKGYGYVGGALFNSVKQDGIFAKVVIKGSLSLWKYQNSFYLQHSEKIYNLKKEGIEGARRLSTSCLEPAVVDKYLKLKESALKELVVRFNDCQNEDYTVLGEKKADFQLEYGLVGGMSNSSIEFLNNPNYEHLQGNFESSDPFYGFSINISLPSKMEGLSIQQEVQFSNSSYFSLITVENRNLTSIHETSIQLREVAFPLSVKLSLVELSGFYPYFQFGTNYRVLTPESSVLTEVINGSVVVTQPETDAFEVKKTTFGTWVGAGVTRRFKSFKGDVFVRHHFSSDISNTGLLSADSNRFAFGVLISYIQEFRK